MLTVTNPDIMGMTTQLAATWTLQDKDESGQGGQQWANGSNILTTLALLSCLRWNGFDLIMCKRKRTMAGDCFASAFLT